MQNQWLKADFLPTVDNSLYKTMTFDSFEILWQHITVRHRCFADGRSIMMRNIWGNRVADV